MSHSSPGAISDVSTASLAASLSLQLSDVCSLAPLPDSLTVQQLPRIIIIGGGPCGIGAALRLQELGYRNWCLYERSNVWGGLSSTLTDQMGFKWDIGGHVVFSHYQYFDDVCSKLGPPKYNLMKRKCLLFMRGGQSVINYPLQNHLHQLPKEVQLSCLQGLLESYWHSFQAQDSKSEATKKSPETFADWGRRVLGRGIVDVFLRPYNEKLWSFPLESMCSSWLGERVAVPDFYEVVRKFATGSVDENWGPNSQFRYPTEGGTGAIWRYAGSHLPEEHYQLGVAVEVIDTVQKQVKLSNGMTDSYDVIINTMPLPDLAKSLHTESEDVRKSLMTATSRLKFSHVVIVGVGVQGKRPAILEDFQWAYFPEPDAPMFRVTALSNYSQAMCPGEGYYSLLCEVGFSQWKPQKCSTEEVGDSVIACLQKYGLLTEESSVVSKYCKHFHYGYPTPSTDRDEILTVVHAHLNSLGILSRGRFGGWKYEAGNMDHSLMQGVEAADAIMSKFCKISLPFKEQLTYLNPNFVNDRKNRSEIPLTSLHNFVWPMIEKTHKGVLPSTTDPAVALASSDKATLSQNV